MPLDEALEIATQMADALEAAHEQGIIHRDLKPANVKLRPDGTVKRLDFGLAKASVRDAVAGAMSGSPTRSVHATQAGVILGTAAYLSPEQARGRPVDSRTDIWAFGCVLLEMLAARPAFHPGETVSDTLAAVLEREPDWSGLPAATPAAILRLLRRCLQKDPRKRLPHIGMVRLEIDDAAEQAAHRPLGTATVPPRSWWTRTLVLASVAVFGAMLGGAILWAVMAQPRPPEVIRLRSVCATPHGPQAT
ncbi:MAG: serine/threonine-protein kinase [Acidobacteriota bacterium]